MNSDNAIRLQQIKDVLRVLCIRPEGMNRTRFFLSTEANKTENEDENVHHHHGNKLLNRMCNAVARKPPPQLVQAASFWNTKKQTEVVTQEQEDEEAYHCPVCDACEEENGEVEFGETDACAHRFCVNCLLTWSATRNECMLCRQEYCRVYKSKMSKSVVTSGERRATTTTVDKKLLRAVFLTKDIRAFVNLEYPYLRQHELVLEYDSQSIVMIKAQAQVAPRSSNLGSSFSVRQN